MTTSRSAEPVTVIQRLSALLLTALHEQDLDVVLLHTPRRPHSVLLSCFSWFWVRFLGSSADALSRRPPLPPTLASPYHCAAGLGADVREGTRSSSARALSPLGLGDCIAIADAKLLANMTPASSTLGQVSHARRLGVSQRHLWRLGHRRELPGSRLQSVSEVPSDSDMGKTNIISCFFLIACRTRSQCSINS
jgi:hypothetical protein